MSYSRVDVHIFRNVKKPGVRAYKPIDSSFDPNQLASFLDKLTNYKEAGAQVVARASVKDNTLTIVLKDLTHPWELLEREMSFWMREVLPNQPTIYLVIAR